MWVYHTFPSVCPNRLLISSDDEDGSFLGSTSSGERIFRLKLSDYWIHWQRAARAAMFDFDYLETITDARALRFYELTNLWRASSNEPAAASSLPTEMEIAYDTFAALLPLPALNSERQISEQIAHLIEPLKNGGYVRSFTFRIGSSSKSECRPQIIFQFND